MQTECLRCSEEEWFRASVFRALFHIRSLQYFTQSSHHDVDAHRISRSHGTDRIVTLCGVQSSEQSLERVRREREDART